MYRLLSIATICLSLILGGCDPSSSKDTSTPQTNTPAITNPYLSTNNEYITLKADNLSQHQILTFMSTQLGFDIKPMTPLDKTISVNVINVTLREALQTVLSGNAYSVTLLYQSQVDLFPKLVTITLGGNATMTEPTPQNTVPQNSASTTHTKPPTSPTPADGKQSPQAMKQFQDNVLASNVPLSAAEPDFLEGMTGTKEDADKVAPMLKDPNVSSDDKEAIINMLQEGARDDVIEPLSTALQDKNPDVVKAAIDAIVFLGDEKDIETLKKLRDSTKDEDIRQAADDGITFLE